MDERIKLLAHNLINNSVKAEAGDKVYIHHIGQATTGLARQDVYKRQEYTTGIR